MAEFDNKSQQLPSPAAPPPPVPRPHPNPMSTFDHVCQFVTQNINYFNISKAESATFVRRIYYVDKVKV